MTARRDDALTADLRAWAEAEAKHQERQAHDAGMTARRFYHEGVASQLAAIAGKSGGGYVGQLVTRDGQRGTRARLGVAAAIAMSEGARSLLEQQYEANAAAWTAEPET